MIAFKLLGKETNILFAVVGIYDEVIAFRSQPFRLGRVYWKAQNQNDKKQAQSIPPKFGFFWKPILCV